MASVLNEAYFHDEAAAFAALETILWPEGPSCPLCGNSDASKIGALKGVRSKPSKKNPNGVERLGLKKCYACRGQLWAVEVASNALQEHDPYSNSPTPKLREAVLELFRLGQIPIATVEERPISAKSCLVSPC